MEKGETKPQKLSPFHLFEERMVVVSYRAWLVVGTLLALTLAFLLWSIFGSIAVKASGRAISLTKQGVINVPSRVKGRVSELKVKPGDLVKAGTPIAVIYDLELDVDLKNAIHRKEELLGDYLGAKKIADKEEKERNISIDRNLESTRYAIRQREAHLPFLVKDVESKKTLYKEGLISASQLADAERLLMGERITLDELKAKVIELNTQREKSYKSDEVKHYQQEYFAAANKVNELKARSSYLTVLSPLNGTILEIQTHAGDEIKEGQSIALIEKPKQANEEYLFYGYIPSEQGNKVKKGMQAELKLGIFNAQKFGYLLGEVIDVSPFPVTDQHLLSVVQSQDLVNFLTNKHEALTEVIVRPIKDPASPSGYRWSSGKGPKMALRSGLVAEMRITVEKRRPISYLFPEWWVVGS
jgi:HlyD family secretion protein